MRNNNLNPLRREFNETDAAIIDEYPQYLLRKNGMRASKNPTLSDRSQEVYNRTCHRGTLISIIGGGLMAIAGTLLNHQIDNVPEYAYRASLAGVGTTMLVGGSVIAIFSREIGRRYANRKKKRLEREYLETESNPYRA